MNRNEKILRHLKKNGRGIEIGPCHNPVAPKKEGFNVDIIDHLNREQLIAKYEGHSIDFDQIEEVDFVWQGESYSELTGKQKYYDWIISSHVIEHNPDIIKFINDCDAILKDDGVLCLVIPDKRYCFDHYRAITGISKVIDTHLSQATVHPPGTVADYFLNVVSQSGQIAWSSNTTGEYKLIHSIADARQTMNNFIDQNVYLDVHGWCFVPHSFRLIINDLFYLGLIPLQEVAFDPTEGCEFYITLGRKGTGIDKSRLEMLETIEAELSQTNSRQSTPFSANMARSLDNQSSMVTESASQFPQTQAEWEKLFSELEPIRHQLQTQLAQTQAQLRQTQAELASSQTQLQQSQQMIEAMKTSKFWQLRNQWFKLKQAFGLATE